MIGTFYNPFADPQDRTPISHCARCGTEIYEEDTCYLEGSMVICERCETENHPVPSMSGRELDLYFKKLYGG